MPRVSRPTLPRAFKTAIAIAMMIAVGAAMIAASPSVAPTPSSSASPHATASAAAANTSAIAIRAKGQLPDGPAVIGFLSRVIGWYRHISVEERLVSDPAEMLFVADDRQMADQVLDLSFEFGKAEANLLAAASGAEASGTNQDKRGGAASGNISASVAKSDQDIKAAQDQLKALQDQQAVANGRKRREIGRDHV